MTKSRATGKSRLIAGFAPPAAQPLRRPPTRA